jgi:hypothetical protein
VCFAPEADAAVGGLVVVVGVDALRHVDTRRQVALASLPLLFGLHQVTEAFVWWGLDDQVAHTVERAALWAYLLFALAVLPVLLPIAVGLVERSPVRRRVIGGFGVLGGTVAIALAVAVFRGPLSVAVDGRLLAYRVDAVGHGALLTGLYVAATCGALLACSDRHLAAIGAANLVAVPVLLWLSLGGFVSLWCFWAAIVSIAITAHLRRATPSGRATPTRADQAPSGHGPNT